MLTRAVKYCLKSLIWATTIFVLVACVLAVRLYLAPVDLGFAQDQLLVTLEQTLPEWRIKFNKARAGWDIANMRPWVRLNQLEATELATGNEIRIPEVEVMLSRYSLAGRPGIASVSIREPDVRIFEKSKNTDAPNLETPQEASTAAVGSDTPKPAKKSSVDLSAFFEADGQPIDDAFAPIAGAILDGIYTLESRTPDLSSITFERGRVLMLRDEVEVSRVIVPRFSVSLYDGDLTLNARLQTLFSGTESDLQFSVKTSAEAGNLTLNLSLADIVPAAVVKALGVGGAGSMLNLPVSIDTAFEFNRDDGLINATVLLGLSRGVLEHEEIYPRPAAIQYGTVRAAYVGGRDYVDLSEIQLGLTPGELSGKGKLYWEDDGKAPGIQVNATLGRASIVDVVNYWPRKTHPNGVERGGRAWINNHMLEGETYDIGVRVDVGPDGQGRLDGVKKWDVGFSFRDLDSYVMQTMPPLYEASGRGYVEPKRLTLTLASARLDKLELGPSTMTIQNLDVKDSQVGEMDLTIAGQVVDMLSVLDRHPLRLVEKIKIPVERMGGTMSAHAKIFAPFQKERQDEITYDVKAEFSELAFDELLGGEGLRGGEGRMTLDNDTLFMTGTARVNDVPLSFSWTEDLAISRVGPTVESTLLEINGYADDQGLEALNVPISRYVDGGVRFDGRFIGRGLKLRKGTFHADMSEARMMVDEIGWQKAPGVSATAEGDIILSTIAKNQVQGLEMRGEGLDATLAMQWSNGVFDLSVQADARQVGENRFTANIEQLDEDMFNIRVDADQFDLRPFIGFVDAENEAEVAKAKEVKDPVGAEFVLTGHVGHVLLLNDETIDDVNVDLKFEDGAPAFVDMTGVLGPNSDLVTLSIQGDDPAAHDMKIATKDAGSLLRGFGYFSHLTGGDMTLEGITSGWGDNLSTTAEARASGAILYPATVLGDHVVEGKLSGLDDSLIRKSGVKLNTIKMPFSYDKGLLDIDKLIANGDALGMTMQGQMHTQDGLINVNGVYVPAYGLNSLLGKIPLLGGLFSGGEGEGLFGFTYRVKGALADPDVSVSAASGFMPGFLRGLFKGGKGKVDDIELPEEEPTADAEGAVEKTEGEQVNTELELNGVPVTSDGQ